MAITSRTASDLVELYVSTFGRAPDEAGLKYWIGEVEAGRMSVQEVGQSFFDQKEATEKFGSGDDADFINKVYNNLFGRESDEAGRDYWVGELQAGNVSRNLVVEAFRNAAKSSSGSADDAAILANKTQVAQYYVTKVGANSTLAEKAIAGVSADSTSVDSAVELVGKYDSLVEKWKQALPTDGAPEGGPLPTEEEMWKNIEDDTFWDNLSQNEIWNQEGANRPVAEEFWKDDDELWEGPVTNFEAINNKFDNFVPDFQKPVNVLNDWEAGTWIADAGVEWKHFDQEKVKDDAIKKYVTLFGEAPSKEELEKWTDDIEYGRVDEKDVVGKMFEQAGEKFQGMSDEEFIRQSYERIFGESDGADLSAWDSKLGAEGDRSEIFKEFFDAADADPTKAAALHNRAQVAEHYMDKVGVDSSLSSKVLDGVTWDPNSIDNGMGLVDYYDGWVDKWEEAKVEGGPVKEEDLWKNIDNDDFWTDLDQKAQWDAGTEAPTAGQKFWEDDDQFWGKPVEPGQPNEPGQPIAPGEPNGSATGSGWEFIDFIKDPTKWHDTKEFDDFNDGYEGPKLPDGSEFLDYANGGGFVPPPFTDDFPGKPDEFPGKPDDFPGKPGEHPDGELPPIDGEFPDGELPPIDGEKPDGELPPLPPIDGEKPDGELPPLPPIDGEKPDGELPPLPPIDGDKPDGELPPPDGGTHIPDGNTVVEPPKDPQPQPQPEPLPQPDPEPQPEHKPEPPPEPQPQPVETVGSNDAPPADDGFNFV